MLHGSFLLSGFPSDRNASTATLGENNPRHYRSPNRTQPYSRGKEPAGHRAYCVFSQPNVEGAASQSGG
jgi:hypothetical protein